MGINSAGIPGAENLGFAIEIDAIRPLIDKLKSGEGTEVEVQAFLGITSAETSQLTPAEAGQLGVAGEDAWSSWSASSPSRRRPTPASQAGDLIRQVNGEAVTGPETVRDAIRGNKPGAHDHHRGRARRPADDALGRARLPARHGRRRLAVSRSRNRRSRCP